MITDAAQNTITASGLPVAQLRGLSTDTKPTTVQNGSTFIEMDTGNVYMFDLDGDQWVAL